MRDIREKGWAVLAVLDRGGIEDAWGSFLLGAAACLDWVVPGSLAETRHFITELSNHTGPRCQRS